MFLKRSYTKEIMDDFSITDERIDNALTELKIINKFLGGNNTSRVGIKKLVPRNNSTILDLGGGGSDNFNFLKSSSTKIYNIDLNIRACKFAKDSETKLNVICADALKLPVKAKQIDIAHVSLFFHHFSEKEIIKILNSLKKISKLGIVINDLRRSILAFMGIKILTSLFSKSNMVKNDGPLSVKKGFSKSELNNILNKCGFHEYKIYRKWAFRWLVIIYL